MENTERQPFEENWKQAFEGAEMTPSDSVWSNLDIRLDNEKMKRRVVYYQRLAAASVLFALLLGIGGVRYYGDTANQDIAMRHSESKAETKKSSGDAMPYNSANDMAKIDSNNHELPELSETASKEGQISGDEAKGIDLKDASAITNDTDDQQPKKATLSNATSSASLLATNTNLNSKRIDQKSDVANSAQHNGFTKNSSTAIQLAGDENKSNVRVSSTDVSSVSELSAGVVNDDGKGKILKSSGDGAIDAPVPSVLFNSLFEQFTALFAPELNQKEVPDARLMPEKKRELPAMPAAFMASSNKKKKDEGVWLALGAAAGSYKPGVATGGNLYSASMANLNGLPASQAPATTNASAGSSYSMGFSIGKKIADRWIVQSGVNYLNQTAGYTSNYITVTPDNQAKAYTSDYFSVTNTTYSSVTQPYKVNSSLEFVSVPVQTGYLIVDRTFGIQLNAGVSTDIFLRNTLKDQSGRSDKYSQGSGSNSPYRAVNWAGLMGTELSYKVGRQYRVALVPGMRYALRPSQKAQSEGNPIVLDVGFRFRYIFE